MASVSQSARCVYPSHPREDVEETRPAGEELGAGFILNVRGEINFDVVSTASVTLFTFILQKNGSAWTRLSVWGDVGTARALRNTRVQRQQ